MMNDVNKPINCSLKGLRPFKLVGDGVLDIPFEMHIFAIDKLLFERHLNAQIMG